MRKINVRQVLALGVGIVIIIVVIGIFLIDPIVESQIEKRGTRAIGAKVELARVDVSFFPMGIALSDLQVTNPDAPMTNAVQVDRIAANLEIGPLLRRKIIIDEMALERARFNTPRATSGAVPGRGPAKTAAAVPADQSCQGLRLPTLGVPDVTTILEKARLASLAHVEGVQAQIERQQVEWKNKLGALPGPDTFDAYRQRIEKLTSSDRTSVAGLLRAPAEIQSLQKDLQRDLDLLKNAQKDLEGEVSGLKGRLGEVKGLAGKDVEALVKKHSLTNTDLKNISRALLGEAFCGWVTQAIDWYDRIKPLLESRSGPQATQPAPGNAGAQADGSLPDFLIRKAFASIELKSGTISGELKNITSDQAVFGLPTAFYLSGEKMKGVNLIQINGVLDHVRPASTKDTLDMTIRGLALEDFVIPTGSSLPLTIRRALAEIRLQSALKGDAIDAVLNTGLKNAVFEMAPEGDAGPIVDIIAQVLQGLSRVDIAAMVNGTLKDYTMRIESGLDQALGPAISTVVQKQTSELRQQFSAAIDARVTPVVSAAQINLAGFDVLQRELASRLDLGKDLTQAIKKPF